MEQRLSLVTLGVADLARSRRFYEEGLGWRASAASTGEVAFFQLGGIALAHNVRTRREVWMRSWPTPARRAAVS